METGARARGLADWVRERALGDAVCGRWVAAVKVTGGYARMTARSAGRSCGGQVLDPPLGMPAKTKRRSARCAILIRCSATRNRRIPLKLHAKTFSNSVA
jgi:hypothetical protein